jgi:hypothetical protein
MIQASDRNFPTTISPRITLIHAYRYLKYTGTLYNATRSQFRQTPPSFVFTARATSQDNISFDHQFLYLVLTFYVVTVCVMATYYPESIESTNQVSFILWRSTTSFMLAAIVLFTSSVTEHFLPSGLRGIIKTTG